VGVLTAFLAVAIVVAGLLRIWVSDGMAATFVSIDSWQILARRWSDLRPDSGGHSGD